jgi:FtsP/CotA-like multicopper oxidase with cupredoxin domain
VAVGVGLDVNPCLGAALSLAALSCQAGADPIPVGAAPLRELARALDVDPDPRVVEVTLVAVPAVHEYVDGMPSSILAFRDGSRPDAPASVPGPLVEATVGDRLVVHFRNELPGLDSTIHWHGLRLPVEMDGNPMVSGAVAPGASFQYDFVLKDAGSFWYHPHVDTDEQMELGLQGAMIVREADPPRFSAERWLVLDDVGLLPDGSIDLALEHHDAMTGRRDGVVLVNGAEAPAAVTIAPSASERWRIVNASNGRYFRLVTDGPTLTVIASDGGFLPQPYEVDELVVAPGERFDLAVLAPEEPGVYALESLEVGRGMAEPDPAAPLLEILVEGEPSSDPSPELPTRAIDPLPVSNAAIRRVELTSDLDNPAGPAFFVNGQRWPLTTPLEAVSGDVEVWEVVNEEPHHHPFHIHGLFFQVLRQDGLPVSGLGWKDTTSIGPRQTVRLAVPYDAPGMWMFHCQIPEHAERGMMGDLMVAPVP